MIFAGVLQINKIPQPAEKSPTHPAILEFIDM